MAEKFHKKGEKNYGSNADGEFFVHPERCKGCGNCVKKNSDIFRMNKKQQVAFIARQPWDSITGASCYKIAEECEASAIFGNPEYRYT